MGLSTHGAEPGRLGGCGYDHFTAHDRRSRVMTKLVIRCHPCVPTSGVALEEWLEERLTELREQIPEAIVRLDRLTQELPSGTSQDGWLLEFQFPESLLDLDRGPVVEALRDMRLLGFSPILLAPASLDDSSELPNRSTSMEHPASYYPERLLAAIEIKGSVGGPASRGSANVLPDQGVGADTIGQASFPASDPPAVWNWEPATADPAGKGDSGTTGS